jgi:hypothetical protein
MKNILMSVTPAFKTAGFLMIGTGLMVWLMCGKSCERYSLGSSVVGAVFVLMALAVQRLLDDEK